MSQTRSLTDLGKRNWFQWLHQLVVDKYYTHTVYVCISVWYSISTEVTYLVDNNFLCRQIQVTVTHEYTVHVCLTDSAKSTSSIQSVTVSQMEGWQQNVDICYQSQVDFLLKRKPTLFVYFWPVCWKHRVLARLQFVAFYVFLYVCMYVFLILGGGKSHVRRAGMLVGKFELKLF